MPSAACKCVSATTFKSSAFCATAAPLTAVRSTMISLRVVSKLLRVVSTLLRLVSNSARTFVPTFSSTLLSDKDSWILKIDSRIEACFSLKRLIDSECKVCVILISWTWDMIWSNFSWSDFGCKKLPKFISPESSWIPICLSGFGQGPFGLRSEREDVLTICR